MPSLLYANEPAPPTPVLLPAPAAPIVMISWADLEITSAFLTFKRESSIVEFTSPSIRFTATPAPIAAGPIEPATTAAIV